MKIAKTPAAPRCRGCRHFRSEATVLEAALPGLNCLASTHASSWSAGGLCVLHDRLIQASARCSAYAVPAIEGAG